MDIYFEHINREVSTNYTIVFLHEGLGCTAMYRDFPKNLCQQSNLNGFIFDRPGYGQSEGNLNNRKKDYLEEAASEMHSFLSKHVKNKIILYGHSDGGSIALIYATLYPERIHAIITEAAHVFVEDITLKGIEQAVLAFNSHKLDGLSKYHGLKYKSVFWAWADTWLSQDFKTWNILPLLKSIQAPILIIQGQKDQYGTMEQVRRINELTAGESSILTPNCGHAPFKELPDLITKETSTFIKKSIHGSTLN